MRTWGVFVESSELSWGILDSLYYERPTAPIGASPDSYVRGCAANCPRAAGPIRATALRPRRPTSGGDGCHQRDIDIVGCKGRCLPSLAPATVQDVCQAAAGGGRIGDELA